MSLTKLILASLLLAGCTHSSWNAIGTRQLSRQNYSRAVDAFSFAVEAEEDLARSFLLRGYAYLKLGRNSEAITDLQKSLKQRKSFSALWILGYAYGANGNTIQAADCFSQLCNEYPKQPFAYWGYGIYDLFCTEDFNHASNCFAEAMKLDDTNVNFMAAYSRALFCVGKTDECMEFLCGKLRNHPKCHTLHLELIAVRLCSDQNEDPKALQEIAACLKDLPNASPLKYQLLARLNAKNGDFEKAAANLRRAIAANQQNDDAFSRIYASSLDDALKEYQNGRLPDAIHEESRRMFLLYAPQMLKISENLE